MNCRLRVWSTCNEQSWQSQHDDGVGTASVQTDRRTTDNISADRISEHTASKKQSTWFNVHVVSISDITLDLAAPTRPHTSMPACKCPPHG